MKTALFAGSFDPITVGHEDIVRRALPLFDRVVVAIGHNGAKRSYFPLEQRLEWIRRAFADSEKVEAAVYEGLTTDFARECGARYLLRGVRNGSDLEYEQQVAAANRRLAPELETVLLMTGKDYVDVSSTLVRELHRHGRSVSDLLPRGVEITLEDKVRGW